MNTQQTSIFALVSIALVFTACQKDSIVDMDILNNKEARVEQQSFDASLNKSIPEPVGFELQQMAEIQRPDCATSSSLESNTGDQSENSDGCYGKYGLHGDSGHGWIEEFGSFTSRVDLVWDPVANEVNGTVTFEFDRESATLVLKAMGSIEKRSTPSEGNTLVVGLEDVKATGPLDLSHFVGQLYIMRADLISDNKAQIEDALIMIKGDFGVENRDPGDYAIERTHNNRFN